MKNPLEDFYDATGEAIQPYFAAFMIERGYRTRSQADNLDYMIWNERRWDEFCAQRKIPVQQRRSHAPEFKSWLADRALDRG